VHAYQVFLSDKAHYKVNARERRAEQRREKRRDKAAAKKERKANIKRSGKWTEERREEMKAKKSEKSMDPAKRERRRLRLLQRHQKLTVQAEKFAAEAQKALAQYKYMTEAKEVCYLPLICMGVADSQAAS